MARALLSALLVLGLAASTAVSAADTSYTMMIQVQEKGVGANPGPVFCERRAVDKTNRVIVRLPGPCKPDANETCTDAGLCIKVTP